MAVFFSLNSPLAVGTLSQLDLVAIIALVPFLGLFILACDYLDGWSRRKALAGIPLVDDGSNLSSKLRWKTSNFDPLKAFASAYQKVGQLLPKSSDPQRS